MAFPGSRLMAPIHWSSATPSNKRPNRAREGDGPVLIECRVPRLWGHYNRDIEHYRPKEDRDQARARDPITTFSNKLIAAGVLTSEAFRELEAQRQIRGGSRFKRSSSAHRLQIQRPPGTMCGPRRHSNRPLPRHSRTAGNKDHQLHPGSQRSSVARIGNASRSPRLWRRRRTGRRHLRRLARSAKNLGADRVFDTPISESAILGSAVGAALMGMKPIVEIMWGDFMLVALDQIINQAANVRYVTGGRSGAPIVVRTQQGVTPGSCAQHSQSLEALLAHIPGLRIAIPATPQDAYSILRTATASPDPCVIFEARGLYQTTGPVEFHRCDRAYRKVRLRKPGRDAVIVTWGTMLQVALDAANKLAEEGAGCGRA